MGVLKSLTSAATNALYGNRPELLEERGPSARLRNDAHAQKLSRVCRAISDNDAAGLRERWRHDELPFAPHDAEQKFDVLPDLDPELAEHSIYVYRNAKGEPELWEVQRPLFAQDGKARVFYDGPAPNLDV